VRITRFEDIEAWKAAQEMTRGIYKVTEPGRFGTDFDLARQLRRAAGSAMSNIAEGFDAGTDPEFLRFLRMAFRSSTEVQSHLHIAVDAGHIDRPTFDRLYSNARDTKGLIGGFMRYLNHRRHRTDSKSASSASR